MQKKVNWLAIFAVVMTCLFLIVAAIALFKPSKEIVPEGYLSPSEINAKVNDAVNNVTSEKNSEITNLQNQILNLQNQTTEVSEEEQVALEGYLIDELFLNDSLDVEVFSDRELNLFDGEVEFDGEDYDAEETLTLKGIELKANGNDYEGNVYMTVPKGAVEYNLTFESKLNTSLIDEDETLQFKFLGIDYEVSKWDGTEITFSKGSEYFLSEGESVAFEGKNIVLDMVLEDSVYVLVDGVGEKIKESQTKTIDGVDIKVKEVLYTGKESQVSKAILIIGEEVELTVEDNEEYEEDSPWNWVINSNSIGLKLVEDFKEVDLDGDEEFPAVGVDEKLCLPNEYVCIQYNGLSEEDTEEYSFELDEKEGTKIRVDGNFVRGIKDYDRVYINKTGIYNRDLELIGTSVELGNTEMKLVLGTYGYIRIENSEFPLEVQIGYDLNKVYANSKNISSVDEDYLSNYGILVSSPEDSCEDNEFTLLVPEKQLEGSISLI